MALQVFDREYAAVVALPAPARYEHFIKRVADAEEVWSLRSADGWVLAGEGGRELVPVWPHPRYAEAAATGEWAGAAPAAIPLEEWIEAWLAGMERDGRGVTVFPVPGGPGVPVEPSRLRADLERELEWYE